MIGSRLLTAYYTFTLALKTCKFVTKIWTIFSGFRLLNYLAIVTTLKRQYKCTSSRKLIFFSIVKTNYNSKMQIKLILFNCKNVHIIRNNNIQVVTEKSDYLFIIFNSEMITMNKVYELLKMDFPSDWSNIQITYLSISMFSLTIIFH